MVVTKFALLISAIIAETVTQFHNVWLVTLFAYNHTKYWLSMHGFTVAEMLLMRSVRQYIEVCTLLLVVLTSFLCGVSTDAIIMLVFHCRIQLTSMSYIKSPAPTIRRCCDVCFIRRYSTMLVNSSFFNVYHRFNKIAIPNYKTQMAVGQGSHWLIESPTILSFTYSPPLSHICQCSIHLSPTVRMNTFSCPTYTVP